jgi:hypothetical protein
VTKARVRPLGARDKDGVTALERARAKGHAEIVRILEILDS